MLIVLLFLPQVPCQVPFARGPCDAFRRAHLPHNSHVHDVLRCATSILNILWNRELAPHACSLRTTLQTALDLEKGVRGTTAGFNTPTFVLDTMGGGGKRDVYSFETYDREHGIAIYTSPAVRPGKQFLFFDPIDTLRESAQRRWSDSGQRAEMLEAAIAAAGAADR